MLECSIKANEKVILPIFYDVNSEDVKLKTELYRGDLKKHEKKGRCEEVQQWKKALKAVARIAGWEMKDKW